VRRARLSAAAASSATSRDRDCSVAMQEGPLSLPDRPARVV